MVENNNNIIELLIIDSFDFSWYKKYLNKRIMVYSNLIEQYPGKYVYQSVDNIGIIDPMHGLTKKQQRPIKIKRILKH